MRRDLSTRGLVTLFIVVAMLVMVAKKCDTDEKLQQEQIKYYQHQNSIPRR